MIEEKPVQDHAAGAAEPVEAERLNPLDQLGSEARHAENALFPPTAAAGEEEEEDAPSTFATAEAPWVGAEQKWLNGEESAPGAAAAGPPAPEDPDRSFPMLGVDDDPLLFAPQIPVLQSIIPAPATGMGRGLKIAIAAVLLLVAAGAGLVIYRMHEQAAARDREILQLRHSSRMEVARLERQIREALAQGGSENEARAKALRAELAEARQGVAAAESDTDGDGERRHRQRGDTEGPEEGSAPEPSAGRAKASGGIDEDPYGDEERATADLLDSAIGKRPTEQAAAPVPAAIQGASEFPLGAAELPKSPSREQVKAAMDAMAPQVKMCGPGSGRIVLSIAVAGATGRVVAAEPTGDHAGTPLGLCAARAVKPAKFPAFGQERLQIKYPFDL